MKKKIILALLILSIISGIISLAVLYKEHNKIRADLNKTNAQQEKNLKEIEEAKLRAKKQAEEAYLAKIKTINISDIGKSIDIPEDWNTTTKVFGSARILVIESPATNFIQIANQPNPESKLVKFHLEIPLGENGKQYFFDNYLKAMESKAQVLTPDGSNYNFIIGARTPLALINDKLTELPSSAAQLDDKTLIFALINDHQEDAETLNGYSLVEDNLKQYLYWFNVINIIKSYRNT